MTSNKLRMCSPLAHGVLINVLCVLHRENEYGKILLRQKFKQKSSNCLNFAEQLACILPFDVRDIEAGLRELLAEDVLKIEGDYLISEKLESLADISQKRSKAGKKGGIKSSKKMRDFAKAKVQANTENENDIETDINNKEGVQNENARKMHESRISGVEEVEVDIWPTFDDFWDAYDHKVDRGRCEPKWDKLKQKEKEAIMAYLPDYLKATPDKDYRRHPSTFLNNRTWEGDLPVNKNRTNGRPNESTFERIVREQVAKGNL